MPLYSLDIAAESQEQFDKVVKYISKHARIKKIKYPEGSAESLYAKHGPAGFWPEVFFHTSAYNAQKILNHLYGSYKDHGLTVEDIQIRSK